MFGTLSMCSIHEWHQSKLISLASSFGAHGLQIYPDQKKKKFSYLTLLLPKYNQRLLAVRALCFKYKLQRSFA